jgi:hypothetical protein
MLVRSFSCISTDLSFAWHFSKCVGYKVWVYIYFSWDGLLSELPPNHFSVDCIFATNRVYLYDIMKFPVYQVHFGLHVLLHQRLGLCASTMFFIVNLFQNHLWLLLSVTCPLQNSPVVLLHFFTNPGLKWLHLLCILLSPSFVLSSALDYFLERKARMCKMLS